MRCLLSICSAHGGRLANFKTSVHWISVGCIEYGDVCPQKAGDDITGLIHHSNQGVQYRSVVYTDRLDECAVMASVGSRGDSYDNALAEMFSSLNKAELIHHNDPWAGLKEAVTATVGYVEWFNTTRLHYRVYYRSPASMEATWRYKHKQAVAA